METVMYLYRIQTTNSVIGLKMGRISLVVMKC
jgi:hypothetical protein